jgi:hypothetical protein
VNSMPNKWVTMAKVDYIIYIDSHINRRLTGRSCWTFQSHSFLMELSLSNQNFGAWHKPYKLQISL